MNLSSKHLKAHSKPYQCHDCCHSFARATDLERHKIKHRLSTIKYACKWPDCTSQHGRKDNLKRHISGVHGKKFQQQEKDMQNELQRIYKESALLDSGLLNGSNLLSAALSGNIWVASILLMQETDLGTRCKDGRTALHLAISKPNNLDMIRFLIDNGASLTVTDGSGETPLYSAISADDMEATTLLLERGATCDIQSSNGQTPLHRAVLVANPKMVRLLLDYGANIAAQDNNGETSLYGALSPERIEIATLLLDGGALCDTKNNKGETPLHRAIALRGLAITQFPVEYIADISNFDGNKFLPHAVAPENVVILRLLLETGVNINAKDIQGRTPLILACGLYDTEIISEIPKLNLLNLLLAHGADIEIPDHLGYTPLLASIKLGSNAAVKFLMQYGAKINQELGGDNPLSLAGKCGHLEIIKVLLLGGAEMNRAGQADVPLYAVISKYTASVSVQLQIIDLLINAGIDINSNAISQRNHKDRMMIGKRLKCIGLDINASLEGEGGNILHEACRKDDHKLVQLLISLGADVDAKSPEGTPLQISLSYGKEGLVSSLLDLGADVNMCSHGTDPPLYIAAQRGYTDIARKILDLGASVDAHGPDAQTALHGASKHGYVDIVDILLNYGANIDAQDRRGDTALHRASRYASLYSQVLKRLLQSGADTSLRNHLRSTAWDEAVHRESFEIARLIRNHEASLP